MKNLIYRNKLMLLLKSDIKNNYPQIFNNLIKYYLQLYFDSQLLFQLILFLILFIISFFVFIHMLSCQSQVAIQIDKVLLSCSYQNELSNREVKDMIVSLANAIKMHYISKNKSTQINKEQNNQSIQQNNINNGELIKVINTHTQNAFTNTKIVIQNEIKQLSKKMKQIQSKLQDSVNIVSSFDSRINQLQQKIQLPKTKTPKQVAQLIKKKKKVTFITGRAVSIASGVPAITDQDQYWQKLEESPYTYLKKNKLINQPISIWKWIQYFYQKKQKCAANEAHIVIDKICNSIKGKSCIITQNIDNLHKQCQQVYKCPHKYQIYEIHGNVMYARCDNCHKTNKDTLTPYEQCRIDVKSQKIPKCPACKNNLRPHVMLFDEAYQQEFYYSQTVKSFASQSDLLIIVGSVLRTGLVKSILADFVNKKGQIIQINTQCIIKQKNVWNLEGQCEYVLHQISKYI